MVRGDDCRRIAGALAHLLATWPPSAGRAGERREYRRLLDAFTAESVDGPEPAGSGTLRLVSTATAADRLGITEQAVTARCRAGKLNAVRVGRLWVIPADALEDNQQ